MSVKKGTLIVTGANGGLGRAIVTQYLSSPEANLYQGLWAVRDPAKAIDIQKSLQSCPNASDHDLVKIDISTLESTRSAAAKINARVASGQLPPIRVLVVNAAAQFVTGQRYTDDRLESTFAVNFLNNFLLICLLLQSMDKGMGRIVIIASWTHDPSHPLNAHIRLEEHKKIFNGRLEALAKPGKDKKGDDYDAGMRRYGASKTLIVMIMYELQRRLNATKEYSNVSALAVDPGAMPGTELLRDSSWLLRFMITLMGVITPVLTWLFPNGYFRTTSKSASDVLTACFDEGKLGKHPKDTYLNGSAKIQSSAETRDEAKQKQLFSQSVQMAGLRQMETVLNLGK